MPRSRTGASDARVDVSVLVPVLNEASYLRESAAAMLAQRFDGTIEFLFADGRSTDGTAAILTELAGGDERVRILANPMRTTPCALNLCLRSARGEYVVRMDAHTIFPPTYVSAGVRRLQRADVAWVAGPSVPRPAGRVGGAVALAMSSWMGRATRVRRAPLDAACADDEFDVDTGVFCGAWRRDDLLAHGGWDERWTRNQDSELAARFLAAGQRIVGLPEMAAGCAPRETLRGLVRQHYQYGAYRARTATRHPESLRRSHLLMSALALAPVGAIVGPAPVRRAACAGIATYATAVAVVTAAAWRTPATRTSARLLPVVLPAMHVSWGAGMLGRLAAHPAPAAIAHALGAQRLATSIAPAPQPVHAPSLWSAPLTAGDRQ